MLIVRGEVWRGLYREGCRLFSVGFAFWSGRHGWMGTLWSWDFTKSNGLGLESSLEARGFAFSDGVLWSYSGRRRLPHGGSRRDMLLGFELTSSLLPIFFLSREITDVQMRRHFLVLLRESLESRAVYIKC